MGACCVFATKERRNSITPDIRQRLWCYISGTARELGMRALIVGGTGDHVHILLSVPGTMSVSEAIQKLKANSSRWVHENGHRLFAWQKSYGAFSIGVAQVQATTRYIESQEIHHQQADFQKEFRDFLRKHGITPADDF